MQKPESIQKFEMYKILRGCDIETNIQSQCYVLTFWPGQKCHYKVMHRKEVTHSNGSYERKSRGRKLADEMGWAKKIPMVHS